MDLNAQRLNVIRTIGTTSEVTQVELNLIPTLIQTHWHSTDEWLDTGRRLIVRGAEATTNILIIQHLDFKGEIFLQILNDHHQEW